jgi:hypothetical protein
MTLFLNNKNANILAFDEVIGKNTEFEANFHNESINETLEIITFLISEECFSNLIDINILTKFKEIIKKTNHFESMEFLNIQKSDKVDKLDNDYFLVGWPSHAIFIFYEKNEDETYDFILINAGLGSEVQGIQKDLCNGIIIFKNINWCNIKNFIIDYRKFYFNSKLDPSFEKDKKYYAFYFLLLDKLLQIKNEVNFKDLISNKKIVSLEINSQILGSCAFTNHINYLNYQLYKINPEGYNNNFNEWYKIAKIKMKIKIYNEIIFLNCNSKYYNTYKYILDTVDTLKKDVSYEKNINKIIKNELIEYNIINNKKEILNRKNIEKEDIFWDVYDFKRERFICYIKENLNNSKKIINFFIFFEKCKCLNNDYINIIPLIELYNLKKNHNIQIPDSILYDNIIPFIKEQIDNKIVFIYASLLLLLVENKINFYEKTEIKKMEINRKIYKFLLSDFPIINGNYICFIKNIINDIMEDIHYFPNIDKNSDSAYKTDKTINFFNNEENNYTFSFILFKIKKSNYVEIDVSEYNNEINFLFNAMLNTNNLFLIDKYYTFEIINNIQNTYTKSLESNIIYSDLPEKHHKELLNEGAFYIYEHELNLFYSKIQKILIEETNNLDKKIFDYIIYFYLCEIKGINIEPIIFNKYNTLIDKYINNLFDNTFYESLFTTYILRYNLNFTPVNEIILIDCNVLIPKTELNLFKSDKYLFKFEEDYCSSLVDFYLLKKIKYKDNNFTILIYKNDDNNLISIQIIKILLENNFNLYFILNFYYFYEKDKIIGILKKNKNDKIVIDNSFNLINFTKNNKKYIIIKDYVDLDENITNFLKLVSHNEICYLFYKEENKEHYYLELDNYDLLFEIYDNKIYYLLNNKNYEVKFNYDYETYNNYGILKLIYKTEIKLLCLFNYLILKENKNTSYKFMNESFGYNNDLDLETFVKKYNKYFYTIINKFNDNYILKSENDLLVILLNCLTYNNPELILKNIRQLQVLLRNYNIENNYLKLLFSKLTNIYSLPIIINFNNNFIFNNYNYSYFDKLFDKYNILFNLENIESGEEYYILKIDNKLKDDYRPFYYYLNNYVVDNIQKDNDIYTNEIIYRLYNNYEEGDVGNKSEAGESDEGKSEAGESYTSKSEISDEGDEYEGYIIYMVLNINIINISKTKVVKKINYEKYISFNPKCLFISLLKNNIKNINLENVESNIEKATKLFDYLIIKEKKYLYPIQEFIMGSGKSSVITPYICILLIEHFLKNKIYNNEIYIIMPEFLINQSYETLMINLFSLYSNVIDIFVYKNDFIKKMIFYNNLINIYLISDTKYKEMFLSGLFLDTNNKYMIYDEVDIMANPLTCELNIAKENEKLLEQKKLFKLTKILYEKLFINNTFWSLINESTNNNNKHNYIFLSITNELRLIINDYFDDICKELNDEDYNKIKFYIKENILNFILTKQFNYDYGIPENYNLIDNKVNYKFKAIPYAGGDNPILGSEFSDPILGYILTYFSYRLLSPNFRLIDKEYIIDMLLTDYYQVDIDEQQEIFIIIKSFFKCKITDILDYNVNKLFYLNNIKYDFCIDDKLFERFILSILNLNSNYNKKCLNISFNDLMLYKYVKNFISFTGTAFMRPPINIDISYLNNKFIDYSKINQFDNVNESIEYIIKDVNKTKLFKNVDENLIENIFLCLHKYEVLIDIGAIFINYNDEMFINRYKNIKRKKKYFVYFDNGIKILNLENNKFEIKDIIKKEDNNVFYYFSNKNITGVDAKEIMNECALALVTITNNTILRDFSQGIFRMRNLLDGSQRIHIFINKIMIDENGIFKGGYLTGGNCNYTEINRNNLLNKLKQNQDLLENKKYKVLLKQNILSLLKNNIKDSKQILFIDPLSPQTKLTNIKKFTKSYLKLSDDYIYDINDLNILSKLLSKEGAIEGKIMCLVKEYFNLAKSFINDKQNLIQKQEQENEEEEEEEEEEEKEKKLSKLVNSINEVGVIRANLRLLNNQENKDKILYIKTSDDYLVIYEEKLNIIFLTNIDVLTKFLIYNSYNNLLEKYTIISLINNNVFGKVISDIKQEKIKLISKYILQNLLSKQKKYMFSKKDQIFIERYHLNFDTLLRRYGLLGGNINYYNKYLKYKNKYLRLKTIIYSK